MSDLHVIFSPRAKRRLKEILDYLYEQQLSKSFVQEYISRFETWLEMVLGQFPDSGTPMTGYGQGIQRIVYREYSFIYRIKGEKIEILTIYKENLP